MNKAPDLRVSHPRMCAALAMALLTLFGAPAVAADAANPPPRMRRCVGPGTVVDTNGKPLIYVHGSMHKKGTGKAPDKLKLFCHIKQGEVQTSKDIALSPDGQFEFSDLPCLVQLSVESRDQEIPCCVPPRMQVDLANAKQNEFEIPPWELTLARGRVLDQTGAPAAGATVELYGRRANGRGLALLMEMCGSTRVCDEPLKYTKLSTDADGRYKVWVDPKCEYRAEVRTDGGAAHEAEYPRFDALPNAEFPDMVLRGS